MMLAVIVAGLILAVLVHEAGHAIVAWGVGLPPSIICMGTGPIIFRTRLWGATLLLRLIPVSGFVLPTLRDGYGRISLALILVAGAASNLAAMALMRALGDNFHDFSRTTDLLAMMQEFIVLGALIPAPTGSHGGTDGRKLLRLLWRRPSGSLTAAYRKVLGPAGAAADHPPQRPTAAAEIVYWFVQYGNPARPKQSREAIVELARILRRNESSDAEMAALIEHVVGHELTNSDGTATLEEIDAWSARGLELSASTSLRVTRGGVLASIGRADEAEAMLEPLLNKEMKPFDALGCRAFLAIAAAARADQAAALQWWKQAWAVAGTPGMMAVLKKLETRLPAAVIAGYAAFSNEPLGN